MSRLPTPRATASVCFSRSRARGMRRSRNSWLALAIGQEAQAQAAWLRIPSFTLEPLDQGYRCLNAVTYRYESSCSILTTDLQVNPAGFVTLYPHFFQAKPGA